MMASPAEKLISCGEVKQYKKSIVMGDKSPKSINKKSSQKQSKNNSAAANKKAAIVSKQASGKKN